MGVDQTLRHARESGTKTMGMGHQRIQGMACMVVRSQLTLVSHSLTTATASNNCANEIDHRLKHKEYE